MQDSLPSAGARGFAAEDASSLRKSGAGGVLISISFNLSVQVISTGVNEYLWED
ncbi:MAG: hypothetical protein K2G28_03955 [Acetatifactor sp.]|nr:hypothetical protein [Acetatifactor sp.]MDE7351484.1 hypothetical protein [Acetatifactor sp.]